MDCSYNEIKKIKLPLGVESISCSGNELDHLELPYPKLTVLSCGYNNFSSINLSACKNTLTDLNINGILMDELDLTEYDKLKYFSGYGCKLKKIKFNPHVFLEWLLLGNNLLETLDIPSYKSLEYVDIANNKFAFSAITPELYRIITDGETTEVKLGFTPFENYEHHIALPIDLSKELHTRDGQVQTQYEWRSLNYPMTGGEMVISPGVFKFNREDYYRLNLRNAQMPLLSFYTNVYVGNYTDIPSLGDDAAISIEVAKQLITIKGIEAGTQVQLLTVSGALLQNAVARENNTCVLNPGWVSKGIYLIRTITKQGKIKTHKVYWGSGL